MSEKSEALFAKVFESMSSKHTYSEAEVRLVMLGMQAEIDRLKAECEALRADAERLDWLLWKLPGDALRYCVGELSDTSDGAEFRAAIDAAMEQTK